MIIKDQLQVLFDEYFKLLQLEVDTFGVKPTEVRHLIGRLGEFYCALKIGGTLARTVNQHGFDVMDQAGKKVSVKTTAQLTGFIPISASTAEKADDLMIIQYVNGKFSVIYYGGMNKAIRNEKVRRYGANYELDISLAKKLTSYVLPE